MSESGPLTCSSSPVSSHRHVHVNALMDTADLFITEGNLRINKKSLIGSYYEQKA